MTGIAQVTDVEGVRPVNGCFRHLGIEVDDALEISEQTETSIGNVGRTLGSLTGFVRPLWEVMLDVCSRPEAEIQVNALKRLLCGGHSSVACKRHTPSSGACVRVVVVRLAYIC